MELHGVDMDGDAARIQPREESVKGALPARYKLNTDDEHHVEIQKYNIIVLACKYRRALTIGIYSRFPKPTFLYSLRTKEGGDYLHERELVRSFL